MGSSHSKKLKEPFKRLSKEGIDIFKKDHTTSTVDVSNKQDFPDMQKTCSREDPVKLDKIASLPPSPTSTSPQSIRSDSYIMNGRRYQYYNNKYILPNDEIEQDRLVQVHFIYKYLFDGNFSAPVKELLSLKQSKRNSDSSDCQQQQQEQQCIPLPKVLDVACGTGTWILEMATEFPNAEFYGIDIAPIYPTAIKPPNTFFTQCDVLNGLPYPDECFDYIHMRHVYTCFSNQEWELVMNEIKRLLKPGGYVEFREIDPILHNIGPATQDFFKHFITGMKENHNIDIIWATRMLDLMKETGDIVDIHRQIRQLHFDLPGALGNMARNSLRTACESYRAFFQKMNGIRTEDYDKTLDIVIEENRTCHSHFDYYNCWGRKALCLAEFHHQDIVDSVLHMTRRYSLIPPKDNMVNSRKRKSSDSALSEIAHQSKLHAVRFADDHDRPAALNKNCLQTSSTEEARPIPELNHENIDDIAQLSAGFDD
ncbi:S-adenosyl-L-methionine-dependent methyltransferase [Blakeslea trispora]|nr:S-adenosyl-L-methionine-dependent methyltransferase [Blakeslea trispora]